MHFIFYSLSVAGKKMVVEKKIIFFIMAPYTPFVKDVVLKKMLFLWGTSLRMVYIYVKCIGVWVGRSHVPKNIQKWSCLTSISEHHQVMNTAQLFSYVASLTELSTHNCYGF